MSKLIVLNVFKKYDDNSNFLFYITEVPFQRARIDFCSSPQIIFST